MSQEPDLQRIFAWRLRSLAGRVTVIEQRVMWIMAGGYTNQTTQSQTSSSSPTDLPPTSRHSDSLLRRTLEKLTGEALSAALMWVGTRIFVWALYALLGLPALAWIARPLLKLLGLG